jgi:hypothetical protein
MIWPRSPQDPWYSNYAMIVARSYDRGHTPAGDAPLLHR